MGKDFFAFYLLIYQCCLSANLPQDKITSSASKRKTAKKPNMKITQFDFFIAKSENNLQICDNKSKEYFMSDLFHYDTSSKT